MILKLNDTIIKDIDNGTLKAKDLVKFVLDNTNGVTDKDDINQTALKDIRINGKHIRKLMVDTWKHEAIIEF